MIFLVKTLFVDGFNMVSACFNTHVMRFPWMPAPPGTAASFLMTFTCPVMLALGSQYTVPL
jgi:hypothetical protein